MGVKEQAKPQASNGEGEPDRYNFTGYRKFSTLTDIRRLRHPGAR